MTADRRSADRRPPAASTGQRLQRLFDSRPLLAQHALVGAAATGALGLAAWYAGPSLAAAQPTWPVLLLGAAAGGVVATAATAWVAWRQARAWQTLSLSARALRQAMRDTDDSSDDPLPLLQAAAEAQQTSVALRRLVELARELRRALQARNAQLGNQLQQRTHELTTLQDLSEGLADSDDLFQLVDEALKALEQTLDYSSASVWAPDRRRADRQVLLMGFRLGETGAGAQADAEAADRLRGRRLSRPNQQRYEEIERERKPIIENNARQSLLSWLWEKVTDDASSSALYRSTRAWMGLPLRFREQVLGVLRVDHQTPGYFDAERVRLLSAVCSQTALAMHHAQLLVHERDLAVQAERNRIARDLHDAVSQTLFASNVIAGTLVKLAEREGAASTLHTQALTLERLNRGALAEMRLLLYELRPDALEGMALGELLQPVIEALRCRGDIRITQELAARDALAPTQRLHLYRMAQESLSNIGKHSGASEATVLWQPDAPDGPTLRLTDNGQGFDTTLPHPGHFGLDNLRSRAAEIGATLDLRSAPGQGTEVCIILSNTPAPPANTP